MACLIYEECPFRVTIDGIIAPHVGSHCGIHLLSNGKAQYECEGCSCKVWYKIHQLDQSGMNHAEENEEQENKILELEQVIRYLVYHTIITPNMNTYEIIQNDILISMKHHDIIRRDVLRSLVSDIKNQTVNAGKEITEDIVIKCIQKSVKQHNDSIQQFESANRNDLASKEILERDILQKYLPQMLDEDMTKMLIDKIINSEKIELIKKNMGLIMKQLGSDVDKKIASKYLNEILK